MRKIMLHAYFLTVYVGGHLPSMLVILYLDQLIKLQCLTQTSVVQMDLMTM